MSKMTDNINDEYVRQFIDNCMEFTDNQLERLREIINTELSLRAKNNTIKEDK